MFAIVILTYSPVNCWARDEHEGKASELINRLEHAEESFSVTVHGAYVVPNEHTFYFLLEADDFESVTQLLGPLLLQDHEADIVPVTSITGAIDAVDVE